jgi:hypothetical protein
VGAFDDPAAGSEAGFVLDRVRLFAAAADVGGESELLGEVTDLAVVVGGVETQPLRPLPGRFGPFDRNRLDRLVGELVVVQVRARWRDPDRDALALGEEAPFRPFLALSVGFGPVLAPPSGALPIAPSIASHSHSIPNWSS